MTALFGSGGGLTLIKRQTYAGAGVAAIDFTSIPAGFRTVRMQIDWVKSSGTGTVLSLLVSANNGASWLSAGYDIHWKSLYDAASGQFGQDTAKIPLSSHYPTMGGAGWVELAEINNAAVATLVKGQVNVSIQSALEHVNHFQWGKTPVGLHNAVRLCLVGGAANIVEADVTLLGSKS